MPDGSLIVTDTSADAVVRVDPVTGDRTVLSGCIAKNFNTFQCFSSGIGTGSPFRSPIGIAVEPDGTLVMADEGNGIDKAAIVRVDPVTGDRTVLSGCDPGADDASECTSLIGTGSPLDFAGGEGGIAVEADGALVVTTLPDAVVRVHPTTGDRTLLSGCDVRIFPCPTPVGAGPPLGPKGIAVRPGGTLILTTLSSAVMRVHPTTGDRVPVSDLRIGSGPLLLSPEGIAEEADGTLVVADRFLRAVVRVEPLTGNRNLISR
jgi:streptogramin lyase